MTVPAQNPVSSHVGNGVTTVFAYNFLCFDRDDLMVLVNYERVTTGYTVTGLGTNSGGTVVFDTPPAAGISVILSLDVVLERETNYQYAGDFQSPTVNRDFDRLWLAVQGLKSGQESSVKFPPGEQAGYLPAIADRRGKALVFNATTGEPEPSQDDYNDQAAAAAASAADAEAANTAAQGAAGAASAAAGAAQGAAEAAAQSAADAEAALTNMASFVTVAPAGTIQATNVQAALEELDGDIQNRLTKFATTPLTNQGANIWVQDIGGMRWNGTAYVEIKRDQRMFVAAASGSWVAPVTGMVECELQGGGGGGGAGGGGYNGTGGGSGGYMRFMVQVTKGTPYAYVVGAGGNPGATSASNGSTGGDTTMFGGTSRGGEGGNGGALSAAGGLGGNATLPGGVTGFAWTGAAGMPGFSTGPTVNGGEGRIGGRGGRGGQASGADTKSGGSGGLMTLRWIE